MIYENRSHDGQFPFIAAQMTGEQPFMTHCHQEMELIVVRRGQVAVKCETEEMLLLPGDVWIAPPFASHSIEGASPDSLRLAVLTDLKVMGAWTKQEDERIDVQNILEGIDLYSGHWREPTAEKARELIEEMYQEYAAQDEGWQLAIKTLINALILLAIREMPRCERMHPNKQVVKLKNILEYVALHYCEEISLENCAAVAGFNPSYLSRYFRQHMGVTFQEYIKRLRIDKARWLLRNEKFSVTEVSYQAGFRDIKTFNKLFKSECGLSPTQFRKSKDMRSLTKA